MQSNPTNESQNQKQSDEYWIVRRHAGLRRRIHSDEECYQLLTASGGHRRAHESEIESNEVCKWCKGEVSQSRTGDRLPAKLLKMDPDDVGREAQS